MLLVSAQGKYPSLKVSLPNALSTKENVVTYLVSGADLPNPKPGEPPLALSQKGLGSCLFRYEERDAQPFHSHPDDAREECSIPLLPLQALRAPTGGGL